MGASKQAPGNVEIRSELRPGDLGTIVLMHGVLYASEYQMDHTFEGHVAAGLGEFAKGYDPQKDRIWMAETDGRIVGSVAISGRENHTGQLRWFLLDPEMRGRGLGQRLVHEAVEFCRQCNYRSVYLWTLSELHTATYLYRKAGFELTEEKTHDIWGRVRTEQRYDLKL